MNKEKFLHFIGLILLLLILLICSAYNKTTHFYALFQGLKYNLIGCIVGIFFGIILGFFLAYIRYLKYTGSSILMLCTEIIKGTPILLQITIACFVIPKSFINLSDFLWCLIIFSINSSAYLSESFLHQFNALEQAYWQTAHYIGFSQKQTMKYIITPIIMQNSRGNIKNEIISLLKDTCVISFVGVSDITSEVKRQSFKSGQFFFLALFSGIIFISLNIIQSFFNHSITIAFTKLLQLCFIDFRSKRS